MNFVIFGSDLVGFVISSVVVVNYVVVISSVVAVVLLMVLLVVVCPFCPDVVLFLGSFIIGSVGNMHRFHLIMFLSIPC